jgi:DNA ligase (NAD+)
MGAAELLELRAKVAYHADRYYREDAPEISDSEYDALFRRLQELEAAHPELHDPNSPTARIGSAPVAGFEPHRHQIPMLSLDNAFGEAELRAFDERVRKAIGTDEDVEYFAELKYDGASISLTYDAGRRNHRGSRHAQRTHLGRDSPAPGRTDFGHARGARRSRDAQVGFRGAQRGKIGAR